MFRLISRSSLRQSVRITRQYSTNRLNANTTPNSRYLIGVLVPAFIAYGYLFQSTQKDLIENSSAADHIREEFAEGDALAREADERLETYQSKLQREDEDKTIKKDEAQAVKKAEEEEKVKSNVQEDQKDDVTKVDDKDKSIGGEKKEQPEGEGEGEPKQEAAFNPETGEINWDCPCLGGMAHGPCGEEFKEAFSCFVFSETEPKGIDCIKKFENMRSCFKRYPEHYKDELYDDSEEEQSTETVEHIVLESTEPAVEQIEEGIEQGKVKPTKTN